MRINKRNLDDFKYSVQILNKNLDGLDCQDLTITEMGRLVTSIYHVLAKWEYVAKDMNECTNNLEDKKEK